jgi:hypothetical protein
MSKQNPPANADWRVGKNNPPKHTRFKKGQSGNPGGRKKGSINVRTALKTVLEREIEIAENGRRVQQPIVVALVARQVHAGLRGDLRAIQNVLDRYERHVAVDDERPEELPEEDEAILQRAQGRGRRGLHESDDPCLEPVNE